MLRIALLITVALAFMPLTACAAGRATILYTGAINGELEPCGCSPETQSGGLARLSGYVKRNIDALKPVLIVDAGNSLAPDTAQGRLKSEALTKSLSAIGFDAAAFYSATTPEAQVPLLDTLKGRVLSDLPGGAKGLSAERGGIGFNVSIDWKARKKGMVNVLLTNRPLADVDPKGWDIVLSSSGETIEEPLRKDGALLSAGYPKGQKIGVITVETGPDNRVSKLSHRWQPLGGDIKDDPEVRAILNGYEDKVAELAKDTEAKSATQGQYLGAAVCVECHRPYSESWEKTRHAGAFTTLERLGKHRNPECVACHTTGYGEEGGFLSPAATPALKGVQCEACHGPGKEHQGEFTPMRAVDKGVCLKCHTKENSPLFDYERYYERIKH